MDGDQLLAVVLLGTHILASGFTTFVAGEVYSYLVLFILIVLYV